MKKYIIAAIAALTLATSANADTDDEKICRQVGSLAETIMTARQEGVSLTTLIVNHINSTSPDFIRNYSLLMIGEAYDMHIFESETAKQSLIELFGKQQYSHCIEARG